MKAIFQHFKTGFILLCLLSILTGLIYPLFIMLFAQLFFSWQANGSLIEHHGVLIGSKLIGQSFSSENYFWSRPSATSFYPYNAALSSGSNMGPTNPDFIATVKNRVATLQQSSNNNQFIPVDLVTASGSGLDPDISPAAAFYQVPRVAKARNKSENEIITLIQKNIVHRTIGLLGEPRVNVLKLNMTLDKEFNGR